MKNFNLSLGIIRIIATFFVVFSHSTDAFVLWPTFKDGTAWNIIYYLNTLSRIAVPVFIILSGYLLLDKDKAKNVKSFYKRRFTRILIPFIVWLPIYYLWTAHWDNTHLTLQYILNSLLHGSIWHLYFLFIILELYLLAPFLVRVLETSSKTKQTILFWGLIVFSIFWAILANLPGPHFDISMYSFTIFIPYIVYFYAGAYLRTVQISRMQAVMLGFLYLILGFITNLVAKGNMSTFIVFDYSPTLLFMSICFFLALKNFHEFFNKKIFSGKVAKIIAFISSTTFGIYLLHFMILHEFIGHFNLNPWQIHAPVVLNACIASVATFLITFVIVALARKVPYAKYIF